MEEFMHRALHVPDDGDDDIDFNSAPSSGQDFLKRVIIEARKCEAVVVANIDSKKLKAQTVCYTSESGCSPAPESFLPSREWQHNQVSQFSDLRSRLSQQYGKLMRQGVKVKAPNLPDLDKEDQWSTFCFGAVSSEGSSYSGTPPLLPVILSLNQHKVETLLEYHVKWMEDSPFSQQKGQWLYALLARLEKPLKPEMCSLVRTMARRCSNLRAALTTPEDAFLRQLNLFICLAGRYFDQADLADP